jgi:hypothetical protein
MRKSLCILLLTLCSVWGAAQATYTTQYTKYTSSVLVGTVASSNYCGVGSTQTCWTQLTGISGKTIASITVAQTDNTLFAVTTDHNAYRHNSGTNTWTSISGNKAGAILQIAAANANTVYARTTLQHNLVYNSTTNAWAEIANDAYPWNGPALLTKDLAVGGDGDLWAVGSDALGCGYRLYHRAVGANTWASTTYGAVQASVGNYVWFRCSDNSVGYIDTVNNTSAKVASATAYQVSASRAGSVALVSTAYQGTPVAPGVNSSPQFVYTSNSTQGGYTCCYKTIGGVVQLATTDLGVYTISSVGNLYYMPLYVPSVSDTIQGTTTCAGAGCPGQLAGNTQHTGTISVRAAGKSGPQTRSSAVTWSSYLQIGTQDTALPMYQGECDDNFDRTGLGCGDFFAESGDITCPFMGSIMSVSVNDYFGVAETFSAQNGNPYNCSTPFFTRGTLCTWPLRQACTPETAPPVFDPQAVDDYMPSLGAWWNIGVCVRPGVGFPWHCGPAPFPSGNALKTPMLGPQPCIAP